MLFSPWIPFTFGRLESQWVTQSIYIEQTHPNRYLAHKFDTSTRCTPSTLKTDAKSPTESYSSWVEMCKSVLSIVIQSSIQVWERSINLCVKNCWANGPKSPGKKLIQSWTCVKDVREEEKTTTITTTKHTFTFSCYFFRPHTVIWPHLSIPCFSFAYYSL